MAGVVKETASKSIGEEVVVDMAKPIARSERNRCQILHSFNCTAFLPAPPDMRLLIVKYFYHFLSVNLQVNVCFNDPKLLHLEKNKIHCYQKGVPRFIFFPYVDQG